MNPIVAVEATLRRSSRLSASTSTALGTSSVHTDAASGLVHTPRKRQKGSAAKSLPGQKRTRHGLTYVETVEEVPEEETPKKTRKTKKQVVYKPEDFPSRHDSDWKVGPHVSAAGGVENTILNAASIGATAFAIFLKSQRKWAAPPYKPETVSAFKSRLEEFGYSTDHILPHGSYLVNLGNPDEEKRQKAYECFLDELQRCEELGLTLYNFHPGSTLGEVGPEESITLIAQCINRAHRDTSSVIILLENMAGMGNVIGSVFSELGNIIKQVENKKRIGVCLDTCHMFAAGYDIRTQEGWDTILAEFDRDVGLQYLRAMHINDSKVGLGAKKDRHENIGLGYLSLSTFARVVVDPRTKHMPLILETPAFDGPTSTKLCQGMDVWKKEVEILNRLSNHYGTPVDDQRLAQWTEEIRKVVRATSAKKAEKELKAATQAATRVLGKPKTGRVRGKKKGKAKEEIDDSLSSLSSLSGEE